MQDTTFIFDPRILKLGGCGMVLILGSHSNGLKLMPSSDYDSWTVNLKEGGVISVFYPRIVYYDQISKLLELFVYYSSVVQIETWFMRPF